MKMDKTSSILLSISTQRQTACSKAGGCRRQFERPNRIRRFRLEQARLMPVRTGAKRSEAMSQVEEAIARMTQIRSRLAPITERLLAIDARLAVVKAADIERPAKISLREFTSNLLARKQQRSPWTMVEKYGMAVRQIGRH
jgi:hypothetical protein